MKECTTPAPCGCLKLEEAERNTDPVCAAEMRRYATEAQEEWGCPWREGGEWPRNAEHLDPMRRHVVASVESTIGAPPGSCVTCPRAVLRLPWVGDAIRARRLNEQGFLVNPDAAMVDAIDQVGIGVSMASVDRMKRNMPKDDDNG